MEPKVSIIIPVYNKEEYLDSCMESIVNQTVKEIEIILINDGSTDGSASVCDKWKEKDSRVIVIHKENEGAALTRNKGIDMAKGTYLSFVDADDYMASDAYEICIKEMEQSHADCCYFGRNLVSRGEILSHSVKLDKRQEYVGEEVKGEFIKFFFGNLPENEYQRNYVTTSACCTFYNKAFLVDNKIRFTAMKYSEDLFFNLEICKAATHITVIPDMLYFNNLLQTSKSRGYKEDRFDVYKTIHDRMMDYVPYATEKEDAIKRIHYKFSLFVCKCVKAEYLNRKNSGNYKAYRNIRRICNDKLTQIAVKSSIVRGSRAKRNVLLKMIRMRMALGILWYYIFTAFVRRQIKKKRLY